MKNINQKTIEEIYFQTQQQLMSVVPLDKWAVLPRGLKFTSAKTKYGMADCHGIIHINRQFISTQHWDLLQAVLRHEFAHLCVGLEQGHNKIFRQCERLFGANFNQKSKQQAIQYAQRITHRYQLLAQFATGDELLIKKAHRKHRKYTHYHQQSLLKYFYQQRPIKRFRYIRISKQDH